MAPLRYRCRHCRDLGHISPGVRCICPAGRLPTKTTMMLTVDGTVADRDAAIARIQNDARQLGGVVVAVAEGDRDIRITAIKPALDRIFKKLPN